MDNSYDLTNKIFGDYIALKEAGSDISRHILWQVECRHCHETKKIRRADLISGRKIVCKHCEVKRRAKAKELPDIPMRTQFFKSRPFSEQMNEEKPDVEILIQEKENIDQNRKISKKTNVHIINEDLLNIPIYYNIVYSINPSLQSGGKYYELLNKYFNISSQLDDYQNIEWENGDIINCHPILFTVIEDALTQNDIYKNKQKAFISLKNYCIKNKIKYLAFPFNKPNEDMVETITQAFNDSDITVCLLQGFQEGDQTTDDWHDLITYNNDV